LEQCLPLLLRFAFRSLLSDFQQPLVCFLDYFGGIASHLVESMYKREITLYKLGSP